MGFVLGVVVGLLIGWVIWGRARASAHHDAHDHAAHDHASEPAETPKTLAPAGSAAPRDTVMTAPGAMAPTGVPQMGGAAERDTSEPEAMEPDMRAPDTAAPDTAEPGEPAAVETTPTAPPVVDAEETEEIVASGTPVGTGPEIDETARDRARAIGIAPATLGARGDDLTRIRGVGPKLQAMLHGLGVYTFAQMAAWSDEDIDKVDANLTAFKGRVKRDDWRAQARTLG